MVRLTVKMEAGEEDEEDHICGGIVAPVDDDSIGGGAVPDDESIEDDEDHIPGGVVPVEESEEGGTGSPLPAADATKGMRIARAMMRDTAVKMTR